MSPTTARRPATRRRANITADQVVADQIKALRDRRGKSQQWLADKIGETQSTVARIESGKRTIAVGELLRISWALDVAPVHLLAASFRPADIPIVDTLRVSPKEARAWVRGNLPIVGSDVRSYFENISDEEAAARQKLWERREQVIAHFEMVDQLLEDSGPGIEAGDDETRRLEGQLAASKRAGRRKRGQKS
jgi:transcriptional regulator with XRE-family HTH domain